MQSKCDKCNKDAVWFHGPSCDKACDDHVPRGCIFCNGKLKEGIHEDSPEAMLEENWIEPVDKFGRKYPCDEWLYFPKGIEAEDSFEQTMDKNCTLIGGIDENGKIYEN